MHKNRKQKEKTVLFHDLHHQSKPLLLPNIWDPIGARLLEQTGYTAVATASAAISFSLGYDDGNNLQFETMLASIKRIAGSVTIPVTADMECGYAESLYELEENTHKLLATGITGINFEDSCEDSESLRDLDEQCERISCIRRVADEADIPLFINARSDIFITRTPLKNPLKEAIRRGKEYALAGASGYYPILIPDANDLKRIQEEVPLPLNALLTKDSPTVKELTALGINRISSGPALFRTAFTAMRKAIEVLWQIEDKKLLFESILSSQDIKRYVREGPES